MLEGMACGCIYIGRSDLDYSVFGMIPDVHFLTYDGSVESLFHCIEEHANEIDKLNSIQQNAAKLLVKLLNTEKQFEKALIFGMIYNSKVSSSFSYVLTLIYSYFNNDILYINNGRKNFLGNAISIKRSSIVEREIECIESIKSCRSQNAQIMINSEVCTSF